MSLFKANIKSDAIFEGASTNRYLRFVETAGQFNGAYLQFEGSTNKFHMGAHPTADADELNDIKAFTLLRSNGYIGIFNTNPTAPLHVIGNARFNDTTIAPTYADFNNRLSVGTPSFGGSRLGDSNLQATSIDTKVLNFKGDNQLTKAALFVNEDGSVMTFKGFDDSIMVVDFTSRDGVLGTDSLESTIANSIEDTTTGGRYINDQGVQHYASNGSEVAQTFFQVLQNTGGLSRIGHWVGRYDGTTYDRTYGIGTDNVVTFNYPVKAPDAVAADDLVTKGQTPDVTNVTGWTAYNDTQYTDVSPFILSPDVKVTLPNNALSKIETQMPSDFTEMYDPITQTIVGNTGDGLNITCEFFAVPTTGSTTTIETSIDIGGAVGEIYPRLSSFPKGTGVVRPISFSISGYTLDTWAANGGAIKVVSNGACEIYGVRYVLTRTHKAR